MTQRLRISAALLTSLVVAWWVGHWAASSTNAKPTATRRTAQHPAALPAPNISASSTRQPEAPPEPTASTNPLLEPLLTDGKTQLSLDQVQAYLSQNKRDAESLITASRLTGDLSLLREAAQRFPNDPRVQLDLAMRSDIATERQAAITALATTDPDNALGSYLAASEAFTSSNADEALRRLTEAAGRTSLNDFTMLSVQSAEEAYLAAGYDPIAAKASAMFSLPVPQAAPLRELGRQIAELSQTYAQSGDAESARAITQMGIGLGQRIQDSLGNLVISELVGQSIETKLLKTLDPSSLLEPSLTTVQQRLDQLAERKNLIKTTVQTVDPTSANLSPQLLSQYLDRQKLLGELAALEWLRAKLGGA
jgi:hypothetical protein